MSVQKHYDEFLAKHYSWMFGDYDAKVRGIISFFNQHQIVPVKSGRAVDLGCGSGFQSMALVDLGFRVLSIDFSSVLLEELTQRRGHHDIEIVHDDILNIQDHTSENTVEVITCMGDTLTHLDSFVRVDELFGKSFKALEPGGTFCLSFRDMSKELKGLDRIIPVRADEHTIMTCFLEYEDQYVNVYDIIYEMPQTSWELAKSCYKKLRIKVEWVTKKLEEYGFQIMFNGNEKGFVTIVASKKSSK